MIRARELINRLWSFFRKDPLDRELDEELASHVRMAVDENIAHGMSAEEARRQALIRFGGVQQARERQRESRGLPWLDELLQDIRFATRQFARKPGFALVAILTLALGIGANTAIFTLTHAVLLRPLPYPHADRLVSVWGRTAAFPRGLLSYREFEEIRRLRETFDEIGLYF